ncbi:hypothetical protein C6N75_19155 [Streptomyces solincola]|uniref:Uncharacterized protein n=1 Tax=Streptomyces solincola TaxID=2100817 RepID=A0A2S9PTC7_9ACTN|nr:hypothetical protein [Streptomyces solincola]PRH77661.1 hypothetical protein C6N75_19155 [Streptomyces solincola]
MWRPPAGTAAVPLDAGVWTRPALRPERTRLPVTGVLPGGVERDDPLPPRPWYRFPPDGRVFRRTLVRLPAARGPWPRALHEERRGRPWADPF